MATVKQIIKRAMRSLAILQSGEEPTAAEAQDAVETFNAMLHAWEHDGIPLNHIDLAYADTFPYPDHHVDPVMYNFAVRYGVEFGKDIPAVVIGGAESGYRNLQNYYVDVPTLEVDTALDSYWNPNGPNRVLW